MRSAVRSRLSPPTFKSENRQIPGLFLCISQYFISKYENADCRWFSAFPENPHQNPHGHEKTHTGGCVKSRQAATGKTAKALARKRFRRSLTTSKNKPQQIVFSWQSCGRRLDPASLHQNKKPFRKEWLFTARQAGCAATGRGAPRGNDRNGNNLDEKNHFG